MRSAPGVRRRVAGAWVLCGALASGCASFDGGTLVPGRSTRGEVEALMGRPAQELEAPGGERLLYFSRLPTGRQTFVARIEGDVLQSLAPCLTPQNFGRIVAAVTTTAEIREWLGPPWRSFRMERMEREVWEYPYAVAPQAYRIAWVQFSSDGVVREVVDGVDWSAYPQSGPRRR